MKKPKAPYKFYVEADVPRRWTLKDLLLWVACDYLPTPQYDDEGREVRESHLTLQENPFNLGDITTSTLNEVTTTRLGLKPSPDVIIQQRMSEAKEPLFSASYYKGIIDKSDDAVVIAENKKLYEEAIDFENYTVTWNREFDEFLDIAQSKIHMMLRNGKLQAQGINISSGAESEMYDIGVSLIKGRKSYLKSFSSIPKTHWYSPGIRWQESCLFYRQDFYFSVLINAEDVMTIFPPDCTSKMMLFEQGSHLVAKTDKDDPELIYSSGKVGRPSKNKDAMAVRIAEKLKTGGLPKKQDAFAHELCEWHLKMFGDSIGLSTVKARLRPYYESASFQESEN